MTDDKMPPGAPRRVTAEHARLAEATGSAEDVLYEANPWYGWGPYLSERAGGTVREDYSDKGGAWEYFPHDHARSRAFRWNEDGMAGLSDIHHDLCRGLALWNGADPVLKERMFGLTGPQGNHGEDVKEYWRYPDALPSHAWLRWRYHYPQAAFPYQQLIDENAVVPGANPSSSCWIPMFSKGAGTGPWMSRTRRPHRPRCWPGSPSRTMRPRRRCAVGGAHPVVPQHVARFR